MLGISVIIPVYNTEKYIVECIESILSNKYKGYEVICVDDGSTDSSLSILNTLASKYDCIKVVSQKNKGQSAARNKAIQIASGKYLYFLDSDDKISNHALKNLFDYMERDNLDVLYFSGNSFYDSEELADQFNVFSKVYLRKGKYENWCDGLSLLQSLRNQGDYSVSPCIQIIRRQFLLDNNIMFYEGIIHEDNLFSFQVILNAKRAKCINDVYFYRRIRESSVMTTAKSYKNLLGYYICFLNILRYINDKEISIEYEYVINGIIRSLKQSVHRNYFAIDDKQRKIFLEMLNASDRIFFYSIILQEMETEVKFANQLKAINSSTMLKVGKIITWPARAVKEIAKKIWRKIYGKGINRNAGM